MAEPREIITRAWRVKGTVLKGTEDYVEIEELALPVHAGPPDVLPPTQRKERNRDIGLRLENWARWATMPGQRVASSQTGAICDLLRRAELGERQISGERRRIDEQDAISIEQNMRNLSTQHRLLLWYCYIKQAHPGEVCRRLSIPQHPATAFVTIFRQAQNSIEALANSCCK